MCGQSSLPCQRINYSLGVCLQALGPCRVGLMPAMLRSCLCGGMGRPTVTVPRPHTVVNIPDIIQLHVVFLCVYKHVHARLHARYVFMGIGQTAAQNRHIRFGLFYSGHDQKTCFMRLPTADSLNEFIKVQMPCCVLDLMQLLFCEELLLFIMSDAQTMS